MVFVTATIATGVAVASSVGITVAGFTAFVVGFVANIAMGLALNALTPKPNFVVLIVAIR